MAAAGLIGMLLGPAAVAAAGPGGFVFTPPPGWTDVSKDAPEADRQKAPTPIRSIAGNYAFYAVNLASGDDGFMENMNAVVREKVRPLLATPAMLAELEKQLQEHFSKQGMPYNVASKAVVKVAGVTAGRIVADTQTPNGSSLRIVQYSIPGDHSHATLTFSTTPDNFGRYEPLFEASAQAIRGAVEPRERGAVFDDSWLIGLVSGAAGGLGAAAYAMRKRKRSEAAAAATRS